MNDLLLSPLRSLRPDEASSLKMMTISGCSQPVKCSDHSTTLKSGNDTESDHRTAYDKVD